jgi:hypothetical protein
MVLGEPAKDQSAFASDSQYRSPFVSHINRTLQKSFALRAVDKFHSTVVFQPKPLGRVRNRYSRISGSASYLKKKLMLLGLQSCFQSSAFAKEQKASQLVAKIG